MQSNPMRTHASSMGRLAARIARGEAYEAAFG
ncbi:hypothetical protein BTH_I2169 [Burkholderia thailandensis E264]|uniref:Uncharacterized protein n=1 Tax=Burkholderia thailandensis (strain ATCC 700388 / DSM 13276 / CCUG 48851 / CIP 106301 / E264) TaxID=271848 RepID=Q2SWK9_BURTA|nr:hypothetical protein BTH_I2169 [Burkholderia thailandensis E264]